MGSFEYLVYFNVLQGVAAKYGLRLLTDYADPQLDHLFEQVRWEGREWEGTVARLPACQGRGAGRMGGSGRRQGGVCAACFAPAACPA